MYPPAACWELTTPCLRAPPEAQASYSTTTNTTTTTNDNNNNDNSIDKSNEYYSSYLL